MANRKRIDDDREWFEVVYINGYTVFMGYLMMGVRGLGVLVITWTTVVLLGGFVSVLGKKDFWCLTGILLVETAGVFNVLLKEKISDLVPSFCGLFASALAMVDRIAFRKGKGNCATLVLSMFLAFVLAVMQALVLAIILCPVAALYMFGMCISAGISLWRLIEHDFNNAEGAANLEPALEIVYSLAVAQGALFGYKHIHAFGAKMGIVKYVADTCSVNEKLVADYLEDTLVGCDKDPSFANGRNLVTYTVDLMMKAKSNGSFIAGIRALSTVTKRFDQAELAKHLLTMSASSSHMTHRLLEILGPTSQYSRDIREHAAWIVALVAGGIHLEEHPGWIHCISSLLAPLDEYNWVPEEYERDSKVDGKRTDYTVDRNSRESDSNILQDHYLLVCEGFNILNKLAAHEGNCRVIIITEGLLPKITAPLVSDLLHRDHHDQWSITVTEESLELMSLLAAIPGDTRTKLRSEISGSEKAIISTLEVVLQCLECGVWLKRRTVAVLLDLFVDMPSITFNGSSSRIFTWMLLLVFLLADDILAEIFPTAHHQMKKRRDITRLAGQMLMDMLSSNQELSTRLTLQIDERNARGMLQSVRVVLGDLTGSLLDAGNISIRLHAAEILGHLCGNYTKDDEYLKELKKAMVNVMPQVLTEVLGYESTREVDLESGEANAHQNTSSSQQQKDEQPDNKKMRKELVSLCSQVHGVWYETDPDFYEGTTDPDLTRQLDEMAEKVCSEHGKPVKLFQDLLKEARETEK